MIDNGIVKTLESVLKDFDGKAVDFMAMSAVINLINRLQAEKEALIAGQETMSKYVEKQQAEIKRLRYNLKAVLNERADHSEAIKEFTELLHCHCENRINNPINQKIQPLTWAVAYEEFEDVVDNLVKEMVGEE